MRTVPIKEPTMTRATESIAAARATLATAETIMQETRTSILQGDTTGDPVTDFLVVYAPKRLLDGSSAAIETHYRELSERLKGKAGQCVLMIERDLDHPDSSSSNAPPLREAFSLGVLADDRLHFELRDRLTDGVPSWTFPTQSYGKCGDHRYVHGEGVPAQAFTGGMHPWYEAIFYTWLEEEIDFLSHALHGLARLSLGVDPTGSITRLDLFIGNDEVNAWCNDLRLYPTRPSAAVVTSRTVNPRRVAMIRNLAEVIGVDPTIIPSVNTSLHTR